MVLMCLLCTYYVSGTVIHKPDLLDQCSSYYVTHCFLGMIERVSDLKSCF